MTGELSSSGAIVAFSKSTNTRDEAQPRRTCSLNRGNEASGVAEFRLCQFLASRFVRVSSHRLALGLNPANQLTYSLQQHSAHRPCVTGNAASNYVILVSIYTGTSWS